MARNETIRAIRQALKRRSGKAWSVKGGRGTSYGWITITASPKRLNDFGYMSDEDRAELAGLLNLADIHQQGESVPSSLDYYREYIDRANGRTPTKVTEPYWD